MKEFTGIVRGHLVIDQTCPAEPLTAMCNAQVVSNKMMKSVLVSVARWKIFPKYKLRKRWTKKYMVRDYC